MSMEMLTFVYVGLEVAWIYFFVQAFYWLAC